jgi:hypothetical protein
MLPLAVLFLYYKWHHFSMFAIKFLLVVKAGQPTAKNLNLSSYYRK